MKKILSHSLLPILVLLVSCQKDFKASEPQLTANGKPADTGPSTKLSTVSLSVAVDDLNGISSDGKGNYVDGSQQVSATIRSSDGNLFIVTNTTFKPRQRWFNFPFNTSLEGKDDYRIVTDAATPLQNMSTASGSNTQLAGMRVWAYTGRGVLAWNMRFDYDASGNGNPATDKVLITRTGANTWVIESTDDATAELLDANGSFVAYYSVPFKLTLTKK